MAGEERVEDHRTETCKWSEKPSLPCQVRAAIVHLSGPVGMGMEGTGMCPSYPKRGNLLSFLPWSFCGILGRCWYSGSSVLQH